MQAAARSTERNLLWIALLTIATVLATGIFACAVPFAALAAVAALDSDRADGILLLGTIWLTNQVAGFGSLGYPLEAQAFGWGLAMGLGTLAAYFAARVCVAALSPYGVVAVVGSALPIAFLAYQAVLYAAGMLLPNGEGAFTYAVVAYVGLVEVVAYIVLLTAHRLAVSAGLLGPNAVEGGI
ncbi:MAG: hypothetical protein H7Y62_10995 [Hyphomicrobium sp.]|nr:hypothetical protein [Hyphomicrobium sp.]